MSVKTQLVATALAEWQRWGGSRRPLHGAQVIAGLESNALFTGYVNDYWKVVGQPGWNGNTPQAWSAAFISFCFDRAGAGAGFPYATGHVDYCRAISARPQHYSGLALADPAVTSLAVGDLLWAARTGDGCVVPPKTYDQAGAALKAGAWFCSHCDIVVALGPGHVETIGGNVGNSVTQTTFATSNDEIVDPRHDWLAVIKQPS